MHNIYILPNHISHIISRYIIAGIIGAPLITACSNSGASYGMYKQKEIRVEDEVSPPPIPIKENKAIQTLNEHGNDSIHVAAEQNNLEEVKRLTTENIEALKAVNKYGNTPLHIAALRGYIEVVKYIIELIKNDSTNSDILNIKNEHGHTPAHQAARKGRQEVYSLLKEAGADLSIQCTKHGMTAPEEEEEELEKGMEEAVETKK